MNTRTKRLSALNYFGAKQRHLDWLLPLFPHPAADQHYLELFGGSFCVFLNKKPDIIETVNDKDGRLYNFFNVLRNNPDELIGALELTMYSREEFIQAAEPTSEPVEAARRLFVRAVQSFNGGLGDSSRKKNSWRTSIGESRKGMHLKVSQWLNKIDGLQHCVERLKTAVIENRDAFELVERYSKPNVFIYADPPYLHDIRTGNNDYLFEMSHQDHTRLADALNKHPGKVAISGYDSELYDTLYKKPRWYKNLGPTRQSNLSDKLTREILWTNYPPPTGIVELFA